MNFYNLSHLTDESNIEEYMKLSRKYSIGCMPDYTHGEYVYFNNINDVNNEHHNHFMLNHITDFHHTSS